MLERWYPQITAVVVALGVFFLPYDLSGKNFSQILSSVITIGAILIGFLATMMSVLITITGRKVIKRISALGASGQFTGYFFVTLTSGFILVVASTALNPFTELKGTLSHFLFVGWIFVVTFFILAAFRIVHLMAKILKSVMEEVDQISNDQVVIPDATNAWANAAKVDDKQV